MELVTRKQRIWQYGRLVLGSGLTGIAFGYYLQVIGRIEMDGPLIVEFTLRAMIIGAFFWTFDIFYFNAPAGAKLRAKPYGVRLAAKVIAYLMLFEIGFVLGWVLFNPGAAMAHLGLGDG